MKLNKTGMWLAVMGLFLLAGCASPGMNVRVDYTPFVNASGGKGELLIVTDAAATANQKALWIIGQVKNSYGEKVTDLVVPAPPTEILAGILADELTSAGYFVKRAATLPTDGAGVKAVKITSVNLSLAETISQVNFQLDAVGSLALSLELWNSGKQLQSFEYRSSFSDSAFRDGDALGQKVLKDAIREVMKQSVPDVVKNLETPK